MTRGAEQRARIRWGVGSAIITGATSWWLWGREGAIAAVVMAVVATGLQMFTARITERSGVPAALDHLKTYLIGVVLRLLGVVVLALAVFFDRRTFPPLAAALGYLGAVLPLLYLETRLAR